MYKKILMWITACLFGIAAFAITGKTTEALTIVLDPGHDDTHTGARGNGIAEEFANLQIALACRNELAKYEGVTVYMIRDAGTCPYGGTAVGSSTNCNARRVDYAASVGANAYISLHNNSSTNTSARGAGVYYPTTNYNYGCGITGQGLAQTIQNQLVAAGLQNRGISVRYSGDNTRYPDGSLADYYGVIRRSKLKGIPAIIVEHAFVSNYSDAVEFLGSTSKMWQLGALDASAIASYYGLQKRQELDYSMASLNVTPRSGYMEYNANISGVYGASSVQFAVWSVAGGQDDLVLYQASDSGNGNWSAVIPIWKHSTEGTYYVDAYVNGSTYMRSASFVVNGPSAMGLDILNADNEKGTFDVRLNGLKSDAGITAVLAAVWKNPDQSDMEWVEMQKNADGTYSYHVDIAKHNYEYGAYQVHIYAQDMNRIMKCVAAKGFAFSPSDVNIQYTKGTLPWNWQLQTEHVPYGSAVRGLYHVLTSEEGTEVLHIDADNTGGQWLASLDVRKLGRAGTYSLATYAFIQGNRDVLLSETEYVAEELTQEVTPVTKEGVTSWDGELVSVHKNNQDRMDVRLIINPWHTYTTLCNGLNPDKRYENMMAYELSWKNVTGSALGSQDIEGEKEPDMPTSGAVTPETVTGSTSGAVTSEEITDSTSGAVTPETVISFYVPEEMSIKPVYVLYAPDAAVSEFTSLEYDWSEDGSYINVVAEAKGIFVLTGCEDRKKGDANSDGAVTLQDAACILRAALRLQQLDEQVVSYCDVDEDGKITLADAQKVLKAVLKLAPL